MSQATAERIVVVYAREDSPRPDTADAGRCAEDVAAVLRGSGQEVFVLPVSPADMSVPAMVRSRLQALNIGLVVNLFEGFSFDSRQEVRFAQWLERWGMPFTGNSSTALALCLHKAAAKKMLRYSGVAVPNGIVLRQDTGEAAIAQLQCPLFIKPCGEDGSVGIDADCLARTPAQAGDSARKKSLMFPRGVMIEEFIAGIEYHVGLIGAPPYTVVGISVSDFNQWPDALPFYSYAAKWDTVSSEYKTVMPRPLTPAAAAALTLVSDAACRAAAVLRCRGYCRVDVRMRDDVPYVIDVNPNPDINTDSGFIRQAAARGWDYAETIRAIVAAGWEYAYDQR